LRCFRFNLSLEKFLGMHVVISPVRRAVSVAYLLSSSKQPLLRRAYIIYRERKDCCTFYVLVNTPN
jgi:hypothetical protein